jgi:hypothetical protein
MERVQVLADGSEQIGRQLDRALTTVGIKAVELEPRLHNLANQQQQQVETALNLKGPGPLRSHQQHLVEALQFRVSGLQGLADAFGQAAEIDNRQQTAAALALQAQRLVASDVVYEDLFREPAIQELQAQSVGGVAVPDSKFVDSADFAAPGSWARVLQRLEGAATGGTPPGLHGTGLGPVKALPAGTQLSTEQETTVTATTDLGFSVTVENTGDNQEQVQLTIRQTNPITRKQTIDEIDPGELKTVTFTNLGQIDFAKSVTVKVDVLPVPGEARRENNSAEFPVIFSLG